MRIPFFRPDIGSMEVERVIETLNSGWITTGAKTKLFENKIAKHCNTSNAVCMNSATAAMELTLRILGIGKGDEVITSAYTYTASASVISHVGATPVLIDTEKNVLEMDYDQLEKVISEKTKAIILVDLAGIICNYERVYSIVEKHKKAFQANNDMQLSFGRIVLIADAAHSFGAKKDGKMSGEIADFTIFSFHVSKNLTTGEGGAVTWKRNKDIDDILLYRQFHVMSLHGQSKDAFEKELSGWEYDILGLYYKCNMTDIAASLGMAQLERYDLILDKRKKLITHYNYLLQNENIQIVNHYGSRFISSGHLYMIRLIGKEEKYRNSFINKMAKIGIALNVHYKPLPMLSAYQNLGFQIKDYPNAYNYFKNEVTLPLYTQLEDRHIEYITNHFIQVKGS